MTVVDDVLRGGIRSGVVDIYGPPASGKTQLALQITRNCISSGGRVLFVDTTGKFRPERLQSMLDAANMKSSLLDMVIVSRAVNVAEQLNVLDIVDLSEYSLVVIDDISELFAFEYFRDPYIRKRDVLFARYMMRLSQTSLENDLPILITDPVRDSRFQKGTMPQIIDIFTHIKIHLLSDDGICASRRGSIEIPWMRSDFYYEITESGLDGTTAAP